MEILNVFDQKQMDRLGLRTVVALESPTPVKHEPRQMGQAEAKQLKEHIAERKSYATEQRNRAAQLRSEAGSDKKKSKQVEESDAKLARLAPSTERDAALARGFRLVESLRKSAKRLEERADACEKRAEDTERILAEL